MRSKHHFRSPASTPATEPPPASERTGPDTVAVGCAVALALIWTPLESDNASISSGRDRPHKMGELRYSLSNRDEANRCHVRLHKFNNRLHVGIDNQIHPSILSGSQRETIHAYGHKKKRRGATLATEEEINFMDELLDKHAADVGHVAIAWNGLHDVLGQLFSVVISPHSRSAAIAAWGAIVSDRSKRDMLKATVLKRFEDNEKELRWVADVEWLLGHITPLEDRRNNAVHAAYGFVLEEGAIKVAPSTWNGNPRSWKLRDKDLGLEFKSCAAHIKSLTEFRSGFDFDSLVNAWHAAMA